MKAATIIISILLISALFLTACQKSVDKEGLEGTGKAGELDKTQGETPMAEEDIDIIAEDEVDIGDLI